MVQRGVEIERLIQVTWDMREEETRRREINGLIEASAATGCRNLFIITAYDNEEIKIDNDTTIHVWRPWRWLLGHDGYC